MTTSHPRRAGRATAVCLVALVSFFLLASNAGAGARKQATLAVEGMVCPNCEATVESTLLDVDGVLAAEANRDNEQAIVTFDPSRASPQEMVAAINSQTYYRASLVATGQAAEPGTPSADGKDGGAGDATGATGAITMYALLAAGIIVLGGGISWFALRARSDTRDSERHGIPTSY